MAQSLLESLTDKLDELCGRDLSDPVMYSIGNGPYEPVNGFVGDAERVMDFGQSASNGSELTVEFNTAEVPARPNKTDRMQFRGRTYIPISARLIEQGRFWLVEGKAA